MRCREFRSCQSSLHQSFLPIFHEKSLSRLSFNVRWCGEGKYDSFVVVSMCLTYLLKSSFARGATNYHHKLTSQASYSPEYITPTQKNHNKYVLFNYTVWLKLISPTCIESGFLIRYLRFIATTTRFDMTQKFKYKYQYLVG